MEGFRAGVHQAAKRWSPTPLREKFDIWKTRKGTSFCLPGPNFPVSLLSGKKMVDLKEKMKTNSKQKKKNKKTSGAGGAAAATAELEAEAATNRHKATAEGPSGDEEEQEEATAANGTAAAGNRTAGKQL